MHLLCWPRPARGLSTGVPRAGAAQGLALTREPCAVSSPSAARTAGPTPGPGAHGPGREEREADLDPRGRQQQPHHRSAGPHAPAAERGGRERLQSGLALASGAPAASPGPGVRGAHGSPGLPFSGFLGIPPCLCLPEGGHEDPRKPRGSVARQKSAHSLLKQLCLPCPLRLRRPV